VAFQVPHVVDVAQGALLHQLFDADVLGREAEVLAVHQDHALLAAAPDHAVALGEVQRHRLVDEDVFAGGGRVQRHLAVEVVRAGDGDGVDEVALQHVLVVDEGVGDAKRAGEHPDVLGVRGGGGHDLRVRHLLQRLRVQAGREPGADDADADGHERAPPPMK
jgi:hypothetical protein